MIKDKSLPHAIFLDIDGTLMDMGVTNALDEGEIPKRNIDAIREARKRGHKIFINTGRGFSCLPRAVLESGAFDGYITGLGSLIEIDGKIVYNCPIPEDMMEMTMDYCKSRALPVRIQCKTKRLCYDPAGRYSDYWTDIDSYDEYKKITNGDFVSKLTFDVLTEQQDVDFLNRNFNLYLHGNAGEATSKGCNKALAMQFALDILGIPAERSIAMGDSVNDIEMLLGSGTSVAMENADAKVKGLSDYITSSCTEGGVGKAIEKLLLK